MNARDLAEANRFERERIEKQQRLRELGGWEERAPGSFVVEPAHVGPASWETFLAEVGRAARQIAQAMPHRRHELWMGDLCAMQLTASLGRRRKRIDGMAIRE